MKDFYGHTCAVFVSISKANLTGADRNIEITLKEDDIDILNNKLMIFRRNY